MVKNVTVTVVGEQRTSREENNVEPIELVTRGSLHEKDGVFYLKYDEYYEDLEKPARNLLKFDKLGLDLTKKGEVSAAMSFRSGETREAFYSTPVGMMNISILTEGYQLVETEKGLGLEVEYFQIVDGDSLQDVASWEDSAYVVGCITVYCGKTPIRLIDHIKYKG